MIRSVRKSPATIQSTACITVGFIVLVLLFCWSVLLVFRYTQHPACPDGASRPPHSFSRRMLRSRAGVSQETSWTGACGAAAGRGPAPRRWQSTELLERVSNSFCVSPFLPRAQRTSPVRLLFFSRTTDFACALAFLLAHNGLRLCACFSTRAQRTSPVRLLFFSRTTDFACALAFLPAHNGLRLCACFSSRAQRTSPVRLLFYPRTTDFACALAFLLAHNGLRLCACFPPRTTGCLLCV